MDDYIKKDGNYMVRSTLRKSFPYECCNCHQVFVKKH